MNVGVWVLAARPKTLTAAIAPVLTGMGLAAHFGAFDLLPALAALVGAVFIQIGTNLANDYYDFVRGGDTEERIGPTRVTQAGLLEPDAVKRGMYVALGCAMAVGVYLVWVGGWLVVGIGLASVACAVLYTGGPYPLAYHGLGDVFVFIFFGLVAVGGTVYVQALTWPPDAWLAGAGLGALSTAILVVNNLRDIETDAKAGKRTLAVRIGAKATQVEYVALVLLSAAVPVLGMTRFGWPATALLGSATVVLIAGTLRTVLTFTDARELNPALGGTARVVAIYGAALGLGLAIG